VSANPGVSRMRTLGGGHAYPPCSHIPGTYSYAILARKFIEPGRVGVALVVNRSPLLVDLVEDVEVVVIGVITSQDIGD